MDLFVTLMMTALPPSTSIGASSAKTATVPTAGPDTKSYVSVWPLAASTLARLPVRQNNSICCTTCSRFATTDATPMFVVSMVSCSTSARRSPPQAPLQACRSAVRCVPISAATHILTRYRVPLRCSSRRGSIPQILCRSSTTAAPATTPVERHFFHPHQPRSSTYGHLSDPIQHPCLDPECGG